MNNKFWKQFAIALALFLAGYFTFNSNLFAWLGL
jgi:NitT/TauT family transport system substrate-binding protein